MDRDLYIKGLKEANEVFGIDNSYLENEKSEKELIEIEKADLDFINRFCK